MHFATLQKIHQKPTVKNLERLVAQMPCFVYHIPHFSNIFHGFNKFMGFAPWRGSMKVQVCLWATTFVTVGSAVSLIAGSYDYEAAVKSRGAYDVKAAASSRSTSYDYKAAAAARGPVAEFPTKAPLTYTDANGMPANVTNAAEWYRNLAEKGDAGAQLCLGVKYDTGEGVKQDYAEALKWYRKSADQGNADANIALADLYYSGRGVAKDKVASKAYLYKAATAGSVAGQYMYANACYNQEPKSFAEAAIWYRKSADQGSIPAQYRLGQLYEKGEGVPQSYAEAEKLWRLAAEKGNSDAQYSLGFMYQNGKGVAKNLVEAAKWYRQAADQGNGSAKDMLEELR